MSQTATQTPASVKPAGFVPANLPMPCPVCGERQATFTLSLNALDGEEALQCCECEANFSLLEMRERVAEMAARWTPALDWIDAAPAFDAE